MPNEIEDRFAKAKENALIESRFAEAKQNAAAESSLGPLGAGMSLAMKGIGDAAFGTLKCLHQVVR